MTSTILTIILFSVYHTCSGLERLGFSGEPLQIRCPIVSSFYQWKRFQNGKMTNMFEQEKASLTTTLPAAPGMSQQPPLFYECKGTSGFSSRHENITVYIIRRNSAQAIKQCFVDRSKNNALPNHPCFLRPHSGKSRPSDLYSVSSNQLVQLDCAVDPGPPTADGGRVPNVTYSWFRETSASVRSPISGLSLFTTSLRMDSVDEESEGVYWCLVNVTYGQPQALRSIERRFEVILKNRMPPMKPNGVVIRGPVSSNVTVLEFQPINLHCEGQVSVGDSIRVIQWGKRMTSGEQMPAASKERAADDKSTTQLQWDGAAYAVLPSSMVRETRRSAVSSLAVLHVSSASVATSGGQYLCVVVADSGSLQHRAFHVRVLPLLEARDRQSARPHGSAANDNSPGSGSRSTFFFLYILVPSLVIAACLFAGVYLTLTRYRVAHKPRKHQPVAQPGHKNQAAQSEATSAAGSGKQEPVPQTQHGALMTPGSSLTNGGGPTGYPYGGGGGGGGSMYQHLLPGSANYYPTTSDKMIV